jgi:hypothetical protein
VGREKEASQATGTSAGRLSSACGARGEEAAAQQEEEERRLEGLPSGQQERDEEAAKKITATGTVSLKAAATMSQQQGASNVFMMRPTATEGSIRMISI